MQFTKALTIVIISMVFLSCFVSLYKIEPVAAVTNNGTVIFHETGLASGTSWKVNIGGSNYSSTSNTISQSWISSVSYSWTVYVPTGYTSTSTLTGFFFLSTGETRHFYVDFTAAASYNVTFTESGLSSGTSWNVTLDGTNNVSTSSTITFTGKSNGNYAYMPTQSIHLLVMFAVQHPLEP